MKTVFLYGLMHNNVKLLFFSCIILIFLESQKNKRKDCFFFSITVWKRYDFYYTYAVFAPLVPLIGYRAVLGLSGYVINSIAFVMATLYLYW